MKHLEKITLPNGLHLDVWDASRRIAADTTKVELVIKMNIPFAADHFAEEDHYLRCAGFSVRRIPMNTVRRGLS